MNQIIHVKSYPEPAVTRREILRYMRCDSGGSDDEKINSLLGECLAELLPELAYKVCWREFAVAAHETDNPSVSLRLTAPLRAGEPEASECGAKAVGSLDLGFMVTESQGLARNLCGCDKLVLFAATIGLAPDRLIAKYGRLSPVKALCMQAIGAERIESLCDMFCGELGETYAADGLFLRPRFSPGYGDLPLEAQELVFKALDCHRKIGLALNDSLLMSPSKSVTAIVGLGATNGAKAGGCASCDKSDCAFRKN